MSTTEGSPFTERLWARHTRYSTHSPHIQLARRIYQAHGDHLPLLTSVQRRWLPAEAAPFGTKLTLPYAWPAVGRQSPSLPDIQRRADVSLVSPGMLRVDSSAASTASTPIATTAIASAMAPAPRTTAPGPMATLQRVDMGIRRPVTAPFASPPFWVHQVQRQAAPPGATPLMSASGHQLETMAPMLPQALSATTVVHPSPVQRSAVTLTSSRAAPTGELETAIVNRHSRHLPEQTIPARTLDTTAVPRRHRAVVSPTRPTDAGALRPAPSMSPSLAIERQAEASAYGRQMPLVETRVRPHLSAMHTAASSRPVARRPDGVSVSPSASPASMLPALAPALGLSIVQRHLAASQRGGQPGVGGLPESVSRDRSGPVSPLVLPRFSQASAGLDRVSHIGRVPELPLARVVDQPSTISGFDQSPSWPLPSAPAHSSLPLATPLAHGQRTAVQRQVEQQLADNGMATNMPPSASVSTPTEALAGSAEIDPNQASQLADIVWRKLMRRLAVESERRGRRIWP